LTAADCKPTQYFVNSSKTCVDCNIQGCVECHTQSRCDTCEEGAKLVSGTGNARSCEPRDGYDWVNGHATWKGCDHGVYYNRGTQSCASCGQGCDNCLTADSCESCTAHSSWSHVTNSCECHNNYQWNGSQCVETPKTNNYDRAEKTEDAPHSSTTQSVDSLLISTS